MTDTLTDEQIVEQEHHLAAVDAPVTVKDARGVERIVEAGGTDDWVHPSCDPDPVETARLERLAGRLEEKQEERLASREPAKDSEEAGEKAAKRPSRAKKEKAADEGDKTPVGDGTPPVHDPSAPTA